MSAHGTRTISYAHTIRSIFGIIKPVTPPILRSNLCLSSHLHLSWQVNYLFPINGVQLYAKNSFNWCSHIICSFSLFWILGTLKPRIIILQVSIISLKWHSTMGIQSKYVLVPILLFPLFRTVNGKYWYCYPSTSNSNSTIDWLFCGYVQIKSNSVRNSLQNNICNNVCNATMSPPKQATTSPIKQETTTQEEESNKCGNGWGNKSLKRVYNLSDTYGIFHSREWLLNYGLEIHPLFRRGQFCFTWIQTT